MKAIKKVAVEYSNSSYRSFDGSRDSEKDDGSSTRDKAITGTGALGAAAAAGGGGVLANKKMTQSLVDSTKDKGVSDEEIGNLKKHIDAPDGFEVLRDVGMPPSFAEVDVEDAAQKTKDQSVFSVDLDTAKEQVRNQFNISDDQDSAYRAFLNPDMPGMSKATAAHELGHAHKADDPMLSGIRSLYESKNELGQKTLEKAMKSDKIDPSDWSEENQQALIGALKRSPDHAAGLAGIGAAATLPRKYSKFAPALPLLAAAPTLIEEGRANINADRIMRNAGVDDLSSKRKTLAKSFGQYAALPALYAGGAYGVNKLRDYLSDEEEEDEGDREKS